MPPRGRKPKPTHLKVVTGNPGKRQLNEHEPKPTSRSRRRRRISATRPKSSGAGCAVSSTPRWTDEGEPFFDISTGAAGIERDLSVQEVI